MLDMKNKQKEVGRLSLSETQKLVLSIIDQEKLDIRVWVKTDSYTGPTKRGIRLYWFDGIWERFKSLMEKADKVYNDLA